MNFSNLTAALVAASVLFSFSAEAKRPEGASADAYACLAAAKRAERKYGMKEHIVATIASVETGRWNEGLKKNTPWPWTVNAGGKGTFFETKAEAVREAKRLRQAGVKSFDVGCMQINMLHHADAFESIEDAFDPEKNVEYGATFLMNLYEKNGRDWFKASSMYHSSMPEKGEYYRGKVVAMMDYVKKNHKEIPGVAPIAAVAPAAAAAPIAARMPAAAGTPVVVASAAPAETSAPAKAKAKPLPQSKPQPLPQPEKKKPEPRTVDAKPLREWEEMGVAPDLAFNTEGLQPKPAAVSLSSRPAGGEIIGGRQKSAAERAEAAKEWREAKLSEWREAKLEEYRKYRVK